MNIRTNQHRSAFYKVLKLAQNGCKNLSQHPVVSNDEDDLYSLGVHLVSDHGCKKDRTLTKFTK